jgi:hypothetical protein
LVFYKRGPVHYREKPVEVLYGIIANRAMGHKDCSREHYIWTSALTLAGAPVCVGANKAGHVSAGFTSTTNEMSEMVARFCRGASHG